MAATGTIVMKPEKTLIEIEGSVTQKHVTNTLNANIRKFNPGKAFLDNGIVTKMLK